MNEQLHQELYDKLKEECHDPTNLYRWILKRFGAKNTRQPQTELKKITAEAYQKGYTRAQSDIVKMITELQAEVITESQDYHVRIAKLSVLSIIKTQIKK